MGYLTKSENLIVSLMKNKGVLNWNSIVELIKEQGYTQRSAEVYLQKAFKSKVLVRVNRGKYKLNVKMQAMFA